MTDTSPNTTLEASIDRTLQAALGYPVVTFVRTVDEVAAVAARDPFGQPMPPPARMYVGFLRSVPTLATRRKVTASSTATDQFRIDGRELYWLCTVPSLKSIASGALLEKMLAGPSTLRNVNTVRRLAAKYPPTA